ncbi:hypothetical protein BBP40_003248 [Aspergillus hancockii]|nr:hypothetical protein BBP40_003248 [Aspergillus hancockii]
MEDLQTLDPHMNKECDVCYRRFTRSEHLVRHRRTHTKERPFACDDCGRRFPRVDVKNLHIKRFHLGSLPQQQQQQQQQYEHQQTPGTGGPSAFKRSRVRVACDNCRRRKIRCSSSIPCAQCSASALVCTNSSITNSEAASQIGSSATLFQPTRSYSGMIAGRGQFVPPPSADRTWDHEPGLNVEAQIDLLNPFGTVMAGGEVNLVEESRRAVESPEIGLGFDGMGVSWLASPMDNAFWLDTSYDNDSSALDTLPVGGVDSSRNLATPAAVPRLTSASSDHQGRMHGLVSQLRNSQVGQPWKPPNLELYDREVVNVFSNIFYDHIPAFFPIFNETAQPGAGRPDYYLSMAAVGGLYCSVIGSYGIARAMYNDARRMILGAASSLVPDTEFPTNIHNALVDVKTLLLLEIYGLCSGDRRSYELTEAHHLDLQLSLYALDLYRVVIMQRPPTIPSYRTSTWISTIDCSEMMGFLDLVDALSTPGAPIDNSTMSKHRFGALASLSPFAWPALRLRSELGHPANPLWNVDFATACCDKWLRAQGPNIDPTSLIMYHTTSLILHVDISLLQRFTARSHGRDSSGLFKALRTWAQSEDHRIALWHARGIFHYIEIIYDRALHGISHHLPVDSSTTQAVGTDLPSTSRRLAIIEAPHLPYATYFATVVLCASAGLTHDPTHEFVAYLTKGKYFLSQSRLRMAQLLSRVLDGARWPSALEGQSERTKQSKGWHVDSPT